MSGGPLPLDTSTLGEVSCRASSEIGARPASLVVVREPGPARNARVGYSRHIGLGELT